MKVEKTNVELISISSAAVSLLENKSLAGTKLESCIHSLLKQTNKLMGDYNEELEDINIELCLVDKVFGKILKDEKGNYEFDKEGILKKKEKVKELLEKKVTLNSRILEANAEHIKDMSRFQIEHLSGLIIPAQEDFESQFDDE